MKTHLPKFFQLVFLLAFLFNIGCKDKKPQETESSDEPLEQEINYDSLNTDMANLNLEQGGANIFLEIKNPDALFKSNDPSIIQAGNPNLAYIGMNSQGKPGDERGTKPDTTAKEFASKVYLDKTVVWILKPKRRDGYKMDFQEVDFGEGKNPDNGNQPCNAFVPMRESVKTTGSNRGAIVAKVKKDSTLKGCTQSYGIIFSIENQSGEKRYFALDPWMIVR